MCAVTKRPVSPHVRVVYGDKEFWYLATPGNTSPYYYHVSACESVHIELVREIIAYCLHRPHHLCFQTIGTTWTIVFLLCSGLCRLSLIVVSLSSSSSALYRLSVVSHSRASRPLCDVFPSRDTWPATDRAPARVGSRQWSPGARVWVRAGLV